MPFLLVNPSENFLKVLPLEKFFLPGGIRPPMVDLSEILIRFFFPRFSSRVLAEISKVLLCLRAFWLKSFGFPTVVAFRIEPSLCNDPPFSVFVSAIPMGRRSTRRLPNTRIHPGLIKIVPCTRS